MSVLEELLKGNKEYQQNRLTGDYSLKRREELVSGQSPKAVVVCCSDSRVVPEAIFNVGLGDIFTIRVAGNVVSEDELASICYAVNHLHSSLVVVLGHTSCGAIASTIKKCSEKYIVNLIQKIQLAIGDEQDPKKASIKNVLVQAEAVRGKVNADVKAALFDIASGEVIILD